jgi:hypothetical protein
VTGGDEVLLLAAALASSRPRQDQQLSDCVVEIGWIWSPVKAV